MTEQKLTVVETGATGPSEINAGTYTTDDLMRIIEAWLAAADVVPRRTE